jgi:ligand-binding sensor domain-containing protein
MLKRAILFFFILTAAAFAKGRFRPGDWVNYGNFRYVNSVAVGFSHVYFGTTEGVLRYDRNRQVFEAPLTKADGLPDNYVRQLAYDQLTDQVYAATQQGGAYFLPAFGEWYLSPFPDSLGNHSRSKLPFLLPRDFGLRYLGDGQVSDNNFRRFRFTDWQEDGFNNLWIGSWGLGPFVADLRTGNLERLPYGLLTSRVNSFYLGSGEVWFACLRKGADGGGLVQWNSKEDKWTYFEAGQLTNFPPDDIHAIAGNKYFVFLGTQDGILRYERKTGYFRPAGRRGGLRGEAVLALLATETGLFAGTRFGVYAVDVKTDSVWNLTTPAISGAVINDLKMAGGYLWAATNRGLYRLAAGEKNWKRFSDPEQITPSTIRTLAVSGEYLWAGGIRGLAKINIANDSTEGWRAPAGEADLDVYALGANGKYVWAAVRSGVYQFDFANREWEFLSELDGLASNEIYQIQTDGDYVWFATADGATRFFWNAPHLRK